MHVGERFNSITHLVGAVLSVAGLSALVTMGADERIRHGHGIWHLFVLAGSVCQFVSVARYVA